MANCQTCHILRILLICGLCGALLGGLAHLLNLGSNSAMLATFIGAYLPLLWLRRMRQRDTYK